MHPYVLSTMYWHWQTYVMFTVKYDNGTSQKRFKILLTRIVCVVPSGKSAGQRYHAVVRKHHYYKNNIVGYDVG